MRHGIPDEEITLFRGNNDSARALQALERWAVEEESKKPPHARPKNKKVRLRLALVHEFKTRSSIFISTEAGAKGLNLQFCESLINYDLPWNPQRVEQRIGRCHRYGQENAVTVINFLAEDNENGKPPFEILALKLDLFGKVLDASDVVIHSPSTDAPETLTSTLGTEVERELSRIYQRARTVQEVQEELKTLRAQVEEAKEAFRRKRKPRLRISSPAASMKTSDRCSKAFRRSFRSRSLSSIATSINWLPAISTLALSINGHGRRIVRSSILLRMVCSPLGSRKAVATS